MVSMIGPTGAIEKNWGAFDLFIGCGVHVGSFICKVININRIII